MEMAVKQFNEAAPEFAMMTEAVAKQMYVYKTSLVKAGFTEEQALEIVKEHGMNIGKLMLGGN